MAFCEGCKRHFAHGAALNQHCANSTRHPYCKPCKRLFNDWAARKQHWQSSVYHASTYDIKCDIDFDSSEARWQHKQASAEHPYLCLSCRLEQPSADELREHFGTDGRHGSTYCFQCDLDFDSEESRWQHKQGSTEHLHMCIPCRLDYPDPAQLQQHLTTDERHKGTYCETCNEDFESRFQRVAHLAYAESCGILGIFIFFLFPHHSYTTQYQLYK